MSISKIQKVSAQETLLVLSLFLYPFAAFSHVLYLIPQALLTLVVLWNSKINLNSNRLLILFFGFIAFAVPALVEFSVVNISHDLYLKLVVNSLTIFALAISPGFFISEGLLKKIRLAVYAWLSVIFLAYALNGVSGLMVVFYGFAGGEALSSSNLYGAATPLAEIFLTKNISAMFMVAVFALYIYLSVNFNKKVSNTLIFFFFILIMSFLSRQGLMGFLAIFFIYKYKSFRKMGKSLTVIVAITAVAYIFKKLFDLSSSEDGASERLLLWKYFFNNYDEFFLTGLSQNILSSTLISNVGIDNFHMFFMNQIGAYGVFHFIAFSFFLILIYITGNGRFKIILVAAYFMNVLFQTFGYEFGNLFLFMVILMKLKHQVETKQSIENLSRTTKYQPG